MNCLITDCWPLQLSLQVQHLFPQLPLCPDWQQPQEKITASEGMLVGYLQMENSLWITKTGNYYVWRGAVRLQRWSVNARVWMTMKLRGIVIWGKACFDQSISQSIKVYFSLSVYFHLMNLKILDCHITVGGVLTSWWASDKQGSFYLYHNSGNEWECEHVSHWLW